ncbi:GNAT family N-acetyltransferase [Planomonospora corallina]|uniref:GNAT family N-acetyltransferase n=1 Tax=Planomonospora corallina TaxID=1806052 RepID=A0ABV8I7M0_9ACTN
MHSVTVTVASATPSPAVASATPSPSVPLLPAPAVPAPGTAPRAESLPAVLPAAGGRRLTLRRAVAADLPGVLALLAETAAWLNRQGVRQWPAGGFPAERIAPLVDRGDMYLLDGPAGPIATVALDGEADPEFWTAQDAPGSALYVHKLAVARGHAGRGLGEALLDWAGLRVVAAGRRWLRLDCAKDNRRLQEYYRRLRFAHLRTVDLPHRASGALFQRPGGLRGATASIPEPIPAPIPEPARAGARPAGGSRPPLLTEYP